MAKGVSWKSLKDLDTVIDTYTITGSEALNGIWYDGLNYYITRETSIQICRADHSSSTMKIIDTIGTGIGDLTGFQEIGPIVGDGAQLFVGYRIRITSDVGPPFSVTEEGRVAVLNKDGVIKETPEVFWQNTSLSGIGYKGITWNGKYIVTLLRITALEGGAGDYWRTVDYAGLRQLQGANKVSNRQGVCYIGNKYAVVNAQGKVAILDEVFKTIQTNSSGGLSDCKGITFLDGPHINKHTNTNTFDSNLVAICHDA